MEIKLPSHRRLNWHYIAIQAGFWAMFASVVAFQTSLLLERGFSNYEIGLVIAVRCGAGIIFQPLLGGFADRHPKIPLKWILSLSLALSLVVGLFFAFTPMGLVGTLIVFAVIGGFEVSAYPLLDAMALQFISVGVPIRYSLGRGMGSMAYAITCVLLGLQVTAAGVESTLLTHAGLVLLVIILCMTYPTFHAPDRPIDEPSEKPHSVFSILRGNPRFTLMLVAVFLGMTACLPMSNFLVNIIQEKGGSSTDLGLAYFLMGAFELPIAFVFPKLQRRFGSGKLLLISAVFISIKAGLLVVAFNTPVLLLFQPLQMLGYGLFTPSSVFFVDESVSPADRVRGQTIMMVASNGLGGMIGGIIAGGILDVGGVNLMLIACVGIGILAAVTAGVALRLKGAKNT